MLGYYIMASPEDEKNVNQLLLEFNTMESDLRMYYLQRLITHLTAAERDAILRYFSTGVVGQHTIVTSSVVNSASCVGGGDTMLAVKKEPVEVAPQPPAMPVYQLPELMPTIKIREPQMKPIVENGFPIVSIAPATSVTPVSICPEPPPQPSPQPPPLKRAKLSNIPAASSPPRPKAAVVKQQTGLCSVCSGEDRNMQHTRTGFEVCRACEAFFTKHAATQDSLVCRKDLSCRIIKKRKQAYCNFCRLTKCISAGLIQDGMTIPEQSQPSPSPPPAMVEKHSKKKSSKREKQKAETKTIISSEPYEQAAATLQALIPAMVNQGLTSCLDDTPEEPQANQLEAVALNQVNFDTLSSIQIPKSLVIGGTGDDSDELQSINFSHGLLRDSDIAISFDDDETDKKS